MTIDSGRGRPGPTWSHKLVSGRIPAIKRRLPEDDLRGAHSKVSSSVALLYRTLDRDNLRSPLPFPIPDILTS